jgi:fibronectin type 3 domain-containing protein
VPAYDKWHGSGGLVRVLLKLLRVALVCGALVIVAIPANASPRKHAHHSVHLTWQPVRTGEKIVGYNIYRSNDGDAKLRKLNASPVSKPEYDDGTVKSGVTYLYVVKSVDAKGVESGPSNQIRLSVPR